MVRWLKLKKMDVGGTCEALRSHSSKVFYVNEDKLLIRVEARYMGDPCMVLLEYKNEEEKTKITDKLLNDGFLEVEIVVEPDL